MKSTLFATTEINHTENLLPPIGYNKVLQNIEKRINEHTLFPVHLICGLKGIGKRMLSEYLAALLLKTDSATYSQINLHPDLLIIENNQDNSLKSEITIDYTRKIKSFLHLTPAQAKCQVVIIDAIDQLNKNAANSILKILEEPPMNSFFFLVCHNPDEIVDTIISRCQKISLPKLTKEDYFQIMKNSEKLNLTSDDLDKIYSIYPERPGEAINFVNSQGLEMMEKIENLIAVKDFTKIKKFSCDYDFKQSKLFNNFYSIISNLVYKKFLLNKKDFQQIEKSNKFLSLFQKEFSAVLNLNLDRKNFIINTIANVP